MIVLNTAVHDFFSLACRDKVHMKLKSYLSLEKCTDLFLCGVTIRTTGFGPLPIELVDDDVDF